MTPFNKGMNALLKVEEQMCVIMHQAAHEYERKTAYDSAIMVRLCINTFAKAYLDSDDAYAKFEKAMKEMQSSVHLRAFDTNLEQLTGWDGDVKGAANGSR